MEPGLPPIDPAAQAAYWAELTEGQRAILDALPTAIGLARGPRIVWINRAFTTLLGYSREETGSLPTTAYFHDVPRFEAAMHQAEAVLMQGRTFQSDLVMRRKNGEWFWGSASGRLLLPEHPEAGIVWMLKDISERKRAEETLRLTQERLEAAQEQAKIGSWELGADLEARYWSKQMYALLGFDPALGLPRTADVHEWVHPEDRIAWEESLRHVLATGEQTRAEFRSNPACGPVRHFESTLRIEVDEHGKPVKVIGTVQDTTERKRVELALRRSEARLEAAQAQAKIGSWELGADRRTHFWSRQVFALFGLDPDQGVPPPHEAALRIHPDDQATVTTAVHHAIETRQPVRFTHRTSPSLGSVRHFEVTVVPDFDEHGRFVRVLGTTQDVTEREQVEEALRLSQARLERAQAQAKIGSWEYYPTTRETFFSDEMYVLLDKDPRLAPPSDYERNNLAHPEERPRIIEAFQRARETDQLVTLEHRGPERSGEPPRYFETTIAAVRDKEGKLLHFAGTFQDVTERHRAADALRDSERRLQRLLGNSSDLIAVLDAEGTQWSIRGPLTSMLGYEPAELEGTPAFALMHPDDIPGATRAFAEATARPGVPYRAEYRYRHKQGGWVEMEAVGTNWLDDPIIRGVIVNVRRITERKQSERERTKLQEQLQQAAKMEAVGRLAGGVAHDFNNLLTIISGNVELALCELHTNAPLAQYLADVGAAAASATSLTRQLLAFSRRQMIDPRVVKLNDLLGNLRNMLGRLLGEDVALELRLCHDLGAVRIDPGQFDQVILNLAVNARDAMPKGGRLTIETTNIELDADYCRTHREINPGAFVCMAVADSGEGMSADTLCHIFEPFFSTKPQGKGTGLGLSVTFGAVKQAGGTIETYSEPGLGTTFKIYLPRVDRPVQKLETAKVAVEALRGTETILVVEDDDRVRGLTTAMLQRLGYQLVVAASGNSALALVQTQHPAIDLLLTDLVMPEMSGPELSLNLRALCPSIGVLYCSGYAEDSFVRHGLGTENLQFIGKPFTLQQLGLKVRQVLDERRKATVST